MNRVTYHAIWYIVQFMIDQPLREVCGSVPCLKPLHMEGLQQTLPNSC